MASADYRHPRSRDFYLFPLRPCRLEIYRVYSSQYVYAPGSDAYLEYDFWSLEISCLYLVQRSPETGQRRHDTHRIVPAALYPKIYIAGCSYVAVYGQRVRAHQQILKRLV